MDTNKDSQNQQSSSQDGGQQSTSQTSGQQPTNQINPPPTELIPLDKNLLVIERKTPDGSIIAEVQQIEFTRQGTTEQTKIKPEQGK